MKTEPSNVTIPSDYHVSSLIDGHAKELAMSPEQRHSPSVKKEPYDCNYHYNNTTCDYLFKKDHRDTTRLYHNSSHVSDHVSVIPWRHSAHKEEEQVACDSSTSPSLNKRHAFAVPRDLKTPPRMPQNITPAEFLALNKHPTPIKDNRPISTTTSLRSTVLDFPSRNSSGLSNKGHSGRGRKRMLSISPLSTDFIDPMMFNEILRTSPSSLVAYVNNNDVRSGFISRCSGRNSSAASFASHGSYGHLSANSASPFSTPIGFRQKSSFTPLKKRVTSFPSSNFQSTSFAYPASEVSNHHEIHHDTPSFVIPHEMDFHSNKPSFQDPSHQMGVTSADVKPNIEKSIQPKQESRDTTDEEGDGENKNQCLWKGCDLMFNHQADLVKHVNTEHIQKNKKDCACYWKDCTREEKPFKAMYMLVVHVRRHTGEKPHKCHYEGCTKAYSRLENLKTHVRSHTGERPYVCEIPGCTKAFSNASDRAKHQNRTHSSIKQYGCKVPGCTKRYTDPSSLRKHMKTVHQSLPQPNKRIKISPNDQNQDHRSNTEKNEERSPQLHDAISRQHIPGYVNEQQGQSSPSYPINGTGSSYPMINNTSREPASDYMNRTWAIENQNQFDRLDIGEQNIPINTRIVPDNPEMPSTSSLGHIGSNLIVQVQPQLDIGERLYKPIEPHPPETDLDRRTSKIRNANIRRGSNVSVGSNDSGMESYQGSRRGSNISDVSVNSGQRTVGLASPMPSRNLTPRCMEPTVIEGEILQNTAFQNSIPQQQIYVSREADVPRYEFQTKDVAVSRLSSGYGSQNMYFPNNRERLSPVPPSSSGPRRASDGNVRRVSDSGPTTTLDQTKLKMIGRRGSEPIQRTTQLIEETARRRSMSTYRPLPVPESMRQSLIGNAPYGTQPMTTNNNTQPNNMGQAANLLQIMARNHPDEQLSTQIQQQIYCENPQMRNMGVHQPQGRYITDCRPSEQINNKMLPSNNLMVVQSNSHVMKAPADSTMDDISYLKENIDPLEAIMNNFNLQQQSSGAYGNPSNHYVQTNSNVERTFNNNHQISNFPVNEVTQSFVYPSCNSVAPIHHQAPIHSQAPTHSHSEQMNNNFNMTLEWRNNHFSKKQVEPDSTVNSDRELEQLMIQGLGSLATNDHQGNHVNNNMSNMTINTMDTLMSSFAEENKYFEHQVYNRFM